MANNIEYIFSLRDRISVRLAGITATSDKTVAALSGVQEKVRTAEDVFRDTGKTIGSLKAKIDALQAEKEWIPADNIPAIREYNREISNLTDELERLETAAGGGRFKKWASEAFDAIPGANLLKNPLVTGITAIGAAGMSGMNFDEHMGMVNITAQLDESGLEDLKKRLRQIAADNKTDVQVTPVGFEAINSQVNDVELSLQILDAALKGSKAGFTDLDTVSAALAQTLSIVGKENTAAQEVLDTFFAAKRVGAGEFADFARYMPNLIAGADNLGIAYKEVAGTFAYMTGKGQSAERAATLMENAFSVLGRVDVRKKLSAAGIKVFDDAGKIRGMVDIFTDLQRVLGGMNDEQKSTMLEQFGLVDKEAKGAFAILMSDTAKLRDSMNDVVNSTGETTAALGYSRNAVQQAAEVWNRFKNIGTQVGEIMLPVISAGLSVADTVLSGVSAVMDTVIGFFGGWFSLLEQGNPVVVGLTSTLGVLTGAMALNYSWAQRAVVIGGIKKALDIAQTAVTGGLTAAQTALNAAFMASPLGLIAAGIGVVIGVVTACWQKFEGFRVAVLGTWGVIKEFGRTLLDSIVKPFKQVLSGIGGVCSAIVSLLKGNFKEAATLAKDGFKDIGEGVLGTNPVSVAYNTIRNGDYAQAWEKGKQAGRDSWAASRQETDTMAANQLMPDVPVVPEPPAANVPDFDVLMKKVAGNAKSGKTVKQPVLRLDDGPVADLSETAEYTAVTRKLEPVAIPRPPQVPKASEKVIPMNPSGIPSSPVVDDRTQSYEGRWETNYLADIMLNVRKIAAAVLVPLTISAAPVNDVQAKEPAPIDLAVPEAAAPLVNVPSPSVSIPDIAVPVPDVPEVLAPAVSVNDTVNVPDIAVPRVQVPEAAAPLVNVPSPSVNVPDIAVPVPDVPEVLAPAVSVNDTVNVPDIAVPRVQVPEAAAPLLNVPSPSVNIPDIAVPTPNVPEVPAPAVSVNDTVNVPDIAVPQVQVPEAAAPLVNVPSPSVSIPDIAVPVPDVPEVLAPAVSVNDTVNVPDIAVPQVQVPEAAAPLVNVPSPSVSIPDIAVPVPDVPEVLAPAVSVNDTVNVPDIAVPQVQVPEAAAPLVNVPSPSVSIPDIAVPVPDVPEIPSPDISDAYNVENVRETNSTFTTDNSRTYNNSGRSVQVGKVCDEVVIHVTNTDRKGADTIRQEIMRILEELGE